MYFTPIYSYKCDIFQLFQLYFNEENCNEKDEIITYFSEVALLAKENYSAWNGIPKNAEPGWGCRGGPGHHRGPPAHQGGGEG